MNIFKFFHFPTPLLPTFRWKCMDIFRENYSVLVLNTPISQPDLMLALWRNAESKILVDGGANRLYDVLFSLELEKSIEYMPDLICGDFDSIKQEVKEHYQSSGIRFEHTPDQNKTDFLKALEVTNINSMGSTIITYCENVGRLDHVMGNLNVLFLVASDPILSSLKVFLLGEGNLSWLLYPGHHIIQIPTKLWNEKSYCGLIPIGNSCEHVFTDGLKWNLYDQKLNFGGIVSSSNTYDVKKKIPEVLITTQQHLLWTMSLDDHLCISHLTK